MTNLKPQEVAAFICPICNVVHLKKEQATSCLKQCSQLQNETKQSEELAKNKEIWRNYVRLNAKSIKEIPDLVKEIFPKLFPDLNVLAFDLKVNFTEEISTAQFNPIGANRNGKIEYLPGFKGSLSLKYEKLKRARGHGFSGVDLFGSSSTFAKHSIFGLNTGSGGSSGPDIHPNVSSMVWDVTLFLADFPEIEKIYAQYLTKIEKCRATHRLAETEITTKVMENAKNLELLACLQKLEAAQRETLLKINQLTQERTSIRVEIQNEVFNSLGIPQQQEEITQLELALGVKTYKSFN